MPLVAIAGGTSKDLGRSIALGILSRYPDGKWTPVILSRSSSAPDWAKDLPANSFQIRQVDYSSPSSLQSALQGCHTVISVILAKDGTQASTQIALLDAAVQVGCKRFVPSEWACGPKGVEQVTWLKEAKTPVWVACEKSGIEWARFNIGSFMNYLGIGCSKLAAEEDEACAGIDREGDIPDGSGSFLISLASGTAELLKKDDGTCPRITLTEMNNIGEFVAASLDLEKWERDMNIVGSTIRLDKLLIIAEIATKKKFKTVDLTKEDLETQVQALDETDFMKRLWIDLKLMVLDDESGKGYLEPVVKRLCPDVKAVDVETYLAKYWHIYFKWDT